MGMFDSVIARCPKCGGEVEFQSKAGPCELKRYRADDVPPANAESIAGDVSTCRACGNPMKLRPATPIGRVRMVEDDGQEWD